MLMLIEADKMSKHYSTGLKWPGNAAEFHRRVISVDGRLPMFLSFTSRSQPVPSAKLSGSYCEHTVKAYAHRHLAHRFRQARVGTHLR